APCTMLVCDPVTGTCNVCDPATQECTPLTCVPPPAPPTAVTNLAVADNGVTPTRATLQFANAPSNAAPGLKFDIRYLPGSTLTAEQFGSAPVAPQVIPGSPGAIVTFTISNLKPKTQYAVAVRAIDPCGQVSPIETTTFSTPEMKFTQLSGC